MDKDVTDTYLDLALVPQQELTVTLRSGGGSVDGTVTTSSDAANNYRVVLVRSINGSSPVSSLELRIVSVAADGKFHVENIRPGSYHAIAVSNAIVGLDDPDVLREIGALGENLSVERDARLQIELHPLSRSDWEALIDRARAVAP